MVRRVEDEAVVDQAPLLAQDVVVRERVGDHLPVEHELRAQIAVAHLPQERAPDQPVSQPPPERLPRITYTWHRAPHRS
ncbi:hypothetical protein GCM10009610_65430 [Pseudonocardia xinjiangensis]